MGSLVLIAVVTHQARTVMNQIKKVAISNDLFCEVNSCLSTIKFITNKINIAVNLVHLHNQLISCSIQSDMIVNNDTLYLTIPIQCSVEQN